MRETNELAQLLAKTVPETESKFAITGDPCKISVTTDSIKIRFNRNYFSTLKLLEDILSKQYKEERGSVFVNDALVKFSYLAQIFLNCFCIEATLHADNIDYSCFELSIFYSAILNLAKQHKFNSLTSKLEQIHLNIFKPENHHSALTALVNTDIVMYKERFDHEIRLFEQQFRLHYGATTKGKVTYIYNLDDDIKTVNHQQLLSKLLHSRQHSYQQQLLLRFLQLNKLDPMLITHLTKNIIDDLLKPENSEDVENSAQNKLATAREQYASTLHNKLKEHTYDSIQPSVYTNDVISKAMQTIFHTNYDAGKLSLNFTSMIDINFGPAKLSIARGCIFRNCIFSSENFINTQYISCTFINCDLSSLTLHGTFKDCEFISCNFTDTTFEWLDLTNCSIVRCNLSGTDWYKVTLHKSKISHSSLSKVAIRFSNIDDAELSNVNLQETLFEGTSIKLKSATQCNWNNANLNGALYFAHISANNNTFTEHLFANIGARLIQLFGNRENYAKLFISSSEITSRLSQIIEDITPITQQNYRERFRQFLGWILCAADRLTAYCEHYQKNKNTFKFKDSITNFEILAGTVKTAINTLNRYLTLYDRCHLGYMSRNLLKNGLFHNYQQYRNFMYKQTTRFLDPYFVDNEKNEDFQYKIKKRESLVEIHRLSETLNKIDKTLSEMRKQITEEEKKRSEENNQSANNLQPPRSIRPNAS